MSVLRFLNTFFVALITTICVFTVYKINNTYAYILIFAIVALNALNYLELYLKHRAYKNLIEEAAKNVKELLENEERKNKDDL